MLVADSPNYKEGFDKKYYLNDGKTIKWWHGHGSFLDYTNPEAVDWWHKQLDIPLDDGIDGWKTDGTDPFVYELILPYGKGGYISERTYANLYYRDFFYYTRKKRGDDALIMARPVDGMYHIYLNFAPRDVVFSGWVGDQDPTFDGLKEALKNMFHSAHRGYVGFGSDIGGYRSGDGKEPLGRSRELFLRWAQLGAFCSLMENGGNHEHRPWMFDQHFRSGNDTVNIYRKFVHAHHELIPYLSAAGAEAYATNKSIMTSLAPETIWTPSTWDYLLGKDIFVSPIVENVLSKVVEFPKGNDWVDYFNSSAVYKGGSKVNYNCPLGNFPVFKRAGSIIPLDVTRSYVGHGDESSSDHVTLLLEHPRKKGRISVSRFVQEEGFEASYLMDKKNSAMIVTISAQPKPVIVLMRGVRVNQQEFAIKCSGCDRITYQITDLQVKVRITDARRGVELKMIGISDLRQ
jgi:alpha-glucosidase (family GH31 glycosyl hydrolase)